MLKDFPSARHRPGRLATNRGEPGYHDATGPQPKGLRHGGTEARSGGRIRRSQEAAAPTATAQEKPRVVPSPDSQTGRVIRPLLVPLPDSQQRLVSVNQLSSAPAARSTDFPLCRLHWPPAVIHTRECDGGADSGSMFTICIPGSFHHSRSRRSIAVYAPTRHDSALWQRLPQVVHG